MNSRFRAGDVDGPNEDGIWTAAIDDLAPDNGPVGNRMWGSRIEMYGWTKDHAIQLQEQLLRALNHD